MGTITDFPISTVDSSLTGADVEAALVNGKRLQSTKPAATVQTLADAVTLAGSSMNVGELVTTVEYNSGTGIGGNTYQLIDAGSSGARPEPDVGSVIHVGAAGLYLKLVAKSEVSPFDFGARVDTPAQEAAIQACEDFASVNGLTVNFDAGSAGEWLTNGPIYKRSYSNWKNGTVRNTNGSGTTDSATILPGGFHPVHFDPAGALDSYTYYSLDPVGITDTVTLSTSADAANFSVGQLVWIVSDITFVGAAGNAYPNYAHLSCIKSIDSGAVSLETPTDCDINTRYGSASICAAEQLGVNDINGNQLSFCREASIDGMSIKSDYGAAMQRGGMYKCRFNFKSIVGKNDIFLNAVCDSEIKTTFLEAFRKVADLAGMSQRSRIYVQSATYSVVNGVTEDSTLTRIGECSRHVEINIMFASFAAYTYSSSIASINSGCQDCSINFHAVNAANAGGNMFTLQQASVTSGNQQTLERCSIGVKELVPGSNAQRGFWMNADAGDNYLLDCGFSYIGVKNGSFSVFAVELGGSSPYISDGHCIGQLRVPIGVSGAYARGYFSDGVSDAGINSDVDISSSAKKSAMAGYYRSTVVVNITTATIGNVYKSYTLDPGAMAAGDRMVLTLQGECLGSNDTKHFRFVDRDTTLSDTEFAAGFADEFEIVITVICQTNSRYTVFTKLVSNGTTTTTDVIDAGVNLAAAVTLDLQMWVANAGDTIRLHRFDSQIDKAL